MIARKATVVLLNTLGGAFLGYLALKVIAVEMGPAVMGQVVFAMGILAFFNLIADLGFGTAHVKRVSEGQDLARCFATYWWSKAILGGVGVLLGLAWILVQTQLFKAPFISTTELVIVIVLAYAYLLGLRSVYTATFDARVQTALTQTVVLAEHLSRVPYALLVALLFGAAATGTGMFAPLLADLDPGLRDALRTQGPALYATTFLVGVAASLLVAARLARRTVPRARPSLALAREYWAFSRPVFLVGIVAAFSWSVDRLALGFFWGDTDVGQYGAVLRIVEMLPIIAASVSLLVFPAVSSADKQARPEEVTRLATQSLRYTSMVLVPAIVFLVVFAGDVVKVMLTDAFLPASAALAVITVSQLVMAMTAILGAVGMGLGRARAVSLATLVVYSGSIALNLILIPTSIFGVPLFGLRGLGAALAMLLAHVAGMVALAWITHDVTHGRWIVPVAKHGLGGVAVGGVLLLVIRPWSPSFGLLPLAGIGICALGLYLGVLWLLREFRKADLVFFLRTLHPVGLGKYVSSELKEAR